MGMPKGKKILGGYAVRNGDGGDFRRISVLMTKMGHAMNHASARNHVLRAMRKFARAITDLEGLDVVDDKIEMIARDPGFQSAIGELVRVELDRKIDR